MRDISTINYNDCLSHPQDNYSTMIRSEGHNNANSYFSRKTSSSRQDWAETTEVIATCVVYDANVHVLALVPGRR